MVERRIGVPVNAGDDGPGVFPRGVDEFKIPSFKEGALDVMPVIKIRM
jgi:hypothetical protein